MSLADHNLTGYHGEGVQGSHGILAALATPRSIAAILLLLAYIFIFLRRRRQKNLELSIAKQYHCEPVIPKVPYKWPFALDLLRVQFRALFSGHTLEALTDYITIADTVRLELWGVTGYITTDPANIETILSTNFDDFGLGNRRVASFPMLGEGIFSQDGHPWKRSRDIIRRQFARVQKQTLQAFTPHVNELVTTLHEAARESAVVDLKPFFFEFTLNTTTELLFGEPQSSLPAETRAALRDSFDYAALGVGIRVRLADLAPLYNPAKFRKACKVVRRWATLFADKAMKYKDEVGEDKASEKYSFIIDLWREMGDEALVRDQLLHILIAGRDSTAALLSWTLFHLIRNPDILQRLREEISTVPPDQHITREQIQKLSFLRCCFNESLRLYPQLALNFRFANKNTVLPRGGGPDGQSPVFIPKYSGVGWSSYHLHRREDLYGANSRQWRPQRWEDGTLLRQVKAGAGFIDFHGGPRQCLGKDFALMEASYAMIRLLQAFPRVRVPPGVPSEPVGAERQSFTIVLAPLDGVKVLLT
ncbi:n-alkane-inducible cytochrome P450 [Xylariomycetidae sp. FL2044]|nr:n-alkane-inducible cytochrome P450 [Xylariomycetidae sp. FL2044]